LRTLSERDHLVYS